jgi:hypothetical protein
VPLPVTPKRQGTIAPQAVALIQASRISTQFCVTRVALQLREVINEGQLIKESKYPEFTKDWRLDSLSKYLPGRPKIGDAKWEKVKEALNS